MVKYKFDTVEIDLEPIQGYPIVVTIGNVNDDNCGATIDGKGCSEFTK